MFRALYTLLLRLWLPWHAVALLWKGRGNPLLRASLRAHLGYGLSRRADRSILPVPGAVCSHAYGWFAGIETSGGWSRSSSLPSASTIAKSSPGCGTQAPSPLGQ